MMYAHTIAIAKSLLADGHTKDVMQMLRPLVEGASHGMPRSTGIKNNRLMLRALLAQAMLLGEPAEKEAIRLFAGQSDRSNSPLQTTAEATMALWKGWVLALPDHEHQNLPAALHLISEAEKYFKAHDRTDCLHWVALGFTTAYLNLNKPDLAKYYLAHANRLLAVLHDPLAAHWSLKFKTHLQNGASQIYLQQTTEEKADYSDPLTAAPGSMITCSARMYELFDLATLATAGHSPILISGLRGTGKRHLARYIHKQSGLADDLFHTINCDRSSGGQPLDQLFTDHFNVQACSRTLFLDHIEQLPVADQFNLRIHLAELSTRDLVQRNRIQIIASTSTALPEQVQKGLFDEALYQQLQVVKLHLHPLKHRREDIPLLVRHFVHRLRPAGIPFAAITEDALEAIISYTWPGNIRQLRNEIERALVHIGQEPFPVIDVEDLSPAIQSRPAQTQTSVAVIPFSSEPYPLDQILAMTECTVIEKALKDHGGQVSAAAETLGLTRQGLYKKMKRLGINTSNTPRINQSPALTSIVNGN